MTPIDAAECIRELLEYSKTGMMATPATMLGEPNDEVTQALTTAIEALKFKAGIADKNVIFVKETKTRFKLWIDTSTPE